MNSPTVPAPHPTRRSRRPWPIALGLFVAAFVAAGAVRAQVVPPSQPPASEPAPPAAGGPVEALQDIIKGEGGPDLAARKDKITQLINGMDLTQLSRVLLLQEWRNLEGGVPRTEAERQRMDDDSGARTLAAERFRQKAKEAIQAVRATPKGTTPERRTNAMLARAATADLIGETAGAGRKLDYLTQISGATTPGRPNQSQPRIGYLAQQLSGLTPDLIELTKLNDPSVPQASALAQRAAARALGQIQPLNPAEVVGALEHLLADRKNSPELRLAAAEAIDSLAQSASDEMQRSLGLDENVQNRFLDFGQAVWTAVLRQGLASDQPIGVRRASLLAFGRIASEMLDISVIPETNGAPPPDLDPTVAKQIEDRMTQYYQRLGQVISVYAKDAGPLAAAARDRDPDLRRTALLILGDLANVRQRLSNLTTGVVPPPAPSTGPPGLPASDGKTIKPPRTSRPPAASVIRVAAEEPSARDKSQQDALGAVTGGLEESLGALRQGLKAPDAATRRSALDVLEVLGPEAYPDVDALTEALGDPDTFVRWAAARTLGNLARQDVGGHKLTAAQTEAAVAGTANLLRDQDVGVRVAAATALEKYGPRAHPAAAILTRAINRSQTDSSLELVPGPYTEPDLIKGDPSVRIAAFRALEAMDGDDTIRALPEAVIALRDGNSQVRQAAADMIARAGPKASPERRAELIRELGKALADPDGDTRRAVSGALLRLVPQNKPK